MFRKYFNFICTRSNFKNNSNFHIFLFINVATHFQTHAESILHCSFHVSSFLMHQSDLLFNPLINSCVTSSCVVFRANLGSDGSDGAQPSCRLSPWLTVCVGHVLLCFMTALTHARTVRAWGRPGGSSAPATPRVSTSPMLCIVNGTYHKHKGAACITLYNEMPFSITLFIQVYVIIIITK